MKTIVKGNKTEKKQNGKKHSRIRLSTEQAEIIKKIKDSKKVYAWAGVFKTHGAYIEVIKSSLINSLRVPLKHGVAHNRYHIENNEFYLG